MTRRKFLKALSAVGGSSLVYSAMTAWGMVRPSQTSLPRLPALSGTGEGTRLVILGAGLAGMTIGYELGKLGYDYVILEARNRAGGQAWTVRNGDELTELGGERQVAQFDEGIYFNPGPWRIPAHHTSTLHYAKEFNVPLEVLVNENDAAYVYNEGVQGPLSGKRVRLREVKADMGGYTSELLAKAINKEELDLNLTKEDQERLIDFLDNFGYLSTPDLTYDGTPARGFVERPSAGTQSGGPHRSVRLYRTVAGATCRILPIGSGVQPAGDHVSTDRRHGSNCERARAGGQASY